MKSNVMVSARFPNVRDGVARPRGVIWNAMFQ
jgi:hypothetical protein